MWHSLRFRIRELDRREAVRLGFYWSLTVDCPRCEHDPQQVRDYFSRTFYGNSVDELIRLARKNRGEIDLPV